MLQFPLSALDAAIDHFIQKSVGAPSRYRRDESAKGPLLPDTSDTAPPQERKEEV